MANEESNLFFKYRTVDEFTIQTIQKQELYFSNSSGFNDPFDSKMDLVWRGKMDDWMQFFAEGGIKDPFICKNIIKQYLKEGVLKDKKDEYLLDPGKKAYKNLEERVQLNKNLDYPRACCFSKEHNNILMWSHYANEHKGICLCFKSKRIDDGNFLFLDSDFHFLFPIIYQEDMPKQVNMLSNYSHEELAAFLRTKHFLWEYEKEYRLIMWQFDFENKDKFTKKFRKEDLEGIIFGLNTPIKDIKMIFKIIDGNYLQEGFKVNFYKAQEMQKKYALRVKKIDDLNRYIEVYS